MILCGSVSLWRSLRVSQPVTRLLPRAVNTGGGAKCRWRNRLVRLEERRPGRRVPLVCTQVRPIDRAASGNVSEGLSTNTSRACETFPYQVRYEIDPEEIVVYAT